MGHACIIDMARVARDLWQRKLPLSSGFLPKKVPVDQKCGHMYTVY